MRVRIMLVGGPFDGQDVMADLPEIGRGTYCHSGTVYRALDKTTSDGLRLFQAVEREDDGTPAAAPTQVPVPARPET
ncbi:MAG: hypothetical protein ABN502_07940 [Gammaproteobacteria bacterium]|uniref:Uncharacterized protein n=3 Tax=Xanthomonas boreopolis TaxID=86183 RepID=A0A919F9N1_9XANT|nr:hypothetical protein [Pseudomonas sp. Hp2]GHH57691.1 hypothetical protein GCM10009090_29210 [[Pseudomonas] boreopolis]